jgi:hypothetical protein
MMVTSVSLWFDSDYIAISGSAAGLVPLLRAAMGAAPEIGFHVLLNWYSLSSD